MDSSVVQNSRQPWSRLEFFLGLFTLGRTWFGKNLSSFQNFHLEPLRDINKPLSRQVETHWDFSTLVHLTFLSDFSHKSWEIFLILAEIS